MWEKLESAILSGREYTTDIVSWTCNCGQQKYHPQHLCKHLVQAVPDPSLRFFREVYQRRMTPIYRHPELRAKSQKELNSYPETDEGTITDGDDHVWLGDQEQLWMATSWDALEGGLTQRKHRRTATPAYSDYAHRSSSPLPYGDEDSENEEQEVSASILHCI